MNDSTEQNGAVFAFAGDRLLAEGERVEVALSLKQQGAEPQLLRGEILVFAAEDGRQIDLHLSGSDADVARRNSAQPVLESEPTAKRGRGRPRLGVVGREVTLLPRHWAWLDTQRGGASATIRRLVDAQRKSSVEIDARRASQDRTNRFLSAMAGDFAGFEEATRALYAGDRPGFVSATKAWSPDVRRVASQLAEQAFAAERGD